MSSICLGAILELFEENQNLNTSHSYSLGWGVYIIHIPNCTVIVATGNTQAIVATGEMQILTNYS